MVMGTMTGPMLPVKVSRAPRTRPGARPADPESRCEGVVVSSGEGRSRRARDRRSRYRGAAVEVCAQSGSCRLRRAQVQRDVLQAELTKVKVGWAAAEARIDELTRTSQRQAETIGALSDALKEAEQPSLDMGN